MTSAQYNKVLDEVENMKAYGHSFLEEAERKRVETLKEARLFIREHIKKEMGPDAHHTEVGQAELLSVSAALCLIENGGRLVPTIQAVAKLNAMTEEEVE